MLSVNLLIIGSFTLSTICAWDIAIVTDEEIEFLEQSRWVGKVSDHLKELRSATYDAIKGDLFVSDSNQPNASIFKINMLSNTGIAVEFQPVVAKQAAVIQCIAFDVVTSTLFWTTGTGHTINKLTNFTEDGQLKKGEILHNLPDQIPQGIAVDSCRQYIYWTNSNPQHSTIERSAMDGTRHELIVKDLFMPLSISVDQQTQKIYWGAVREGIEYAIERSNLDGSNRETVISGTLHDPTSIGVTASYIYWSDWVNKVVWSLQKPGDKYRGGNEPEIFKEFKAKNTKPMAVLSNIMFEKYDEHNCFSMYRLKKQISENMAKWQIPTIKSVTSIISPSQIGGNITIDENICLNNGTLLPDGQCECIKGYHGPRCHESFCYNYCMNGGNCTVDGKIPKCSCPFGKIGARCETDVCSGVCLNDGICTTKDNKVSCRCEEGFIGDRCETKVSVLKELCNGYCQYYEIWTAQWQNDDTKTTPVPSDSSSIDSYIRKSSVKSSVHPVVPSVCNCSEYSSNDSRTRYELLKESVKMDKGEKSQKAEELVGNNSSNRTNLLVYFLGFTCIVLLIAVVCLSTWVCTQKKRPRIRKRIVVSQPQLLRNRLPATPDQYEITIENCCNMNVCDTPCFEPRSSRPTFYKKSAEDKKGLLENTAGNCSRDEDIY